MTGYWPDDEEERDGWRAPWGAGLDAEFERVTRPSTQRIRWGDDWIEVGMPERPTARMRWGDLVLML